ncbi:MAG: hypothetical protein JST22_01760 [Bacteroidetes bacterium]|nr:hypothetical protein [Bacteroidota bacterium]
MNHEPRQYAKKVCAASSAAGLFVVGALPAQVRRSTIRVLISEAGTIMTPSPTDRNGFRHILVVIAIAGMQAFGLRPQSMQAQAPPGSDLFTTVRYVAGWNMIGLPNTPFYPSVDVMFPAAASPLFTYNNGYVTDSILRRGTGYWIKLDAPRTVRQPGISLALPQTIPLAAGWNLICSGASEPAPAASVVVTGTTLQSGFFGFSDGYYVAATIDPGRAYWVKSATRGAITFNR